MTEYRGSAAENLDHYFGSCIAVARIWFKEGRLDQDFDSRKQKFLEGMQRDIDQNLPECNGVDVNNIKEYKKLAELGDWKSVETIKMLYKAYYKIRDDIFDEKRLFG